MPAAYVNGAYCRLSGGLRLLILCTTVSNKYLLSLIMLYNPADCLVSLLRIADAHYWHHSVLDVAEEMIRGLQQMSWTKVDMNFHSATIPFLAHNHFHVCSFHNHVSTISSFLNMIMHYNFVDSHLAISPLPISSTPMVLSVSISLEPSHTLVLCYTFYLHEQTKISRGCPHIGH